MTTTVFLPDGSFRQSDREAAKSPAVGSSGFLLRKQQQHHHLNQFLVSSVTPTPRHSENRRRQHQPKSNNLQFATSASASNRFLGIVVLTGDDSGSRSNMTSRNSCSSATKSRSSADDISSAILSDPRKDFNVSIGYGDEDDDDVFQASSNDCRSRRRKTIGNRPSLRECCWKSPLVTLAKQRPCSRSPAMNLAGYGVSPPQIGHHDVVKVRLKRKIGAGGFGSVYLGVFGDRFVAVKKLHRCVKNAVARAESFTSECNVVKLRHPNIVRVLAASTGYVDHRHRRQQEHNDGRYQGGTNSCSCLVDNGVIVMEYAGQRNLLSIINDWHQNLNCRRRIRFALDIAQALNFLHKALLVHLDLKPANVIVGANDMCKLGDFGCCQVLDGCTGRVSPTQRASLLTGTFAYRAPELLRGEAPSTKADIYSFGVTLWQMESRTLPYAGQDPQAVIYSVVAYNVRPNTAVGATTGWKTDEVNEVDAATLNRLTSSSTLDEDNAVPSYRRLYSHCWDAKLFCRPSADEMVDVLSSWTILPVLR